MALAVAFALSVTVLVVGPHPTVEAAPLGGTFLSNEYDPGAGGSAALGMTVDGQRFRLTSMPIGTSWNEGTPALSPDGSSVAVNVNCGLATGCTTGHALAILDVFGSAPRQLFEVGSGVGGPAWSPDGASLVVPVRDAWDGPVQLQFLPAAGGPPTPSVTVDFALDPTATWVSFSPDGSRVAVAAAQQTGGPRFAVIDVATGQITDLVTTAAPPGGSVGWNATGDAVVHGGIEVVNGAARFRVRSVPVDGSPATLLIDRPASVGESFVTLSPDRTMFVASKRVSGQDQYFAEALDGSSPPLLLGGRVTGWAAATLTPPAVDPPTVEVFDPGVEVVPEGSEYAFTAQSFDDSADAVDVDWGDGTVERLQLAGSPDDGDRLAHVYTTAGTYDISVVPIGAGGRGEARTLQAVVVGLDVSVSPFVLLPGEPATVDLALRGLPEGWTIGDVSLFSPSEVSPSNVSTETFDVAFSQVGGGDLLVDVVVLDDTGEYRGQVAGSRFVAVVAPAGDPGGIVTTYGGELFAYPTATAGEYRDLTFGLGDASDPSWDDTGTRVVFQRSGDIWIVGHDGRGLTQLTDGGETDTSPDLHGDTLVYLRNGSPVVAPLADAESADPIPVTTAPGSVVAVELLGSGDRIGYSDGTSLRSVDLDGTDPRTDRAPGTRLDVPDWSWAGGLVAAIGGGAVQRIDLRSGARSTVPGTSGSSTVAASPDGTEVAYTGEQYGSPFVRIVGVDGAGDVGLDSGTVGDWWGPAADDPPGPDPDPVADLRVEMTAATEVEVGGDVGLTLAVVNDGPSAAEDVEASVITSGPVSASLPEPSCQRSPAPDLNEHLCALGTIAPGARVEIPTSATMSAPGIASVHLTAYGSTDDPDRSNDGAAVLVWGVEPEPEPEPVDLGTGTGGVFTFSVTENRPGAPAIAHFWRPGDAAAKPLLALPAGDLVYGPDLSPDGKLVAAQWFDSDRSGSRVAVFPVGGDEPLWEVPLLEGVPGRANSSANASWSPDGSQLVFSRVQEYETGRQSTWIANADGTGLRLVEDLPGTPAWGPDPDTVFVSRLDCHTPGCFGHPVVVAIDLDTGATRTVASSTVITAGVANGFLSLSAARPDEVVVAERDASDPTWTARRYVTGSRPNDTDSGIQASSLAASAPGPVLIRSRAAADPLVTYDFRTRSYGPSLSLPPGMSTAGALNWSPAGDELDLPSPWDHGDPTVIIEVSPGNPSDPDPGCNPAPGDCTLAEAIEHLDEIDPGKLIVIDLPDGDRISVTEPLAPITRPVTIIGHGTYEDILPPPVSHGEVGLGQTDDCGRNLVVVDGRGIGGHGFTIRSQSPIPTRVHGVAILGFGGDGIRVSDASTVRVQCSSIQHNGGAGITVHDSTDVAVIGDVHITGNAGDGLRITGQSRRVRTWAAEISGNGGLAVDLRDDGVTRNDVNDPDTGPNGVLNHPDVIRIIDDVTSSDPSRMYAVVRPNTNPTHGPVRVDLYAGGCNRFGVGELGRWAGGGLLSRSPNGIDPVLGTAAYLVPIYVSPGWPVTATNTTRAGTSEVSPCRRRGEDLNPGLQVTNGGGVQFPFDPVAGPGGLHGGGGAGTTGLYGEDLDDGPNGQGSEDHPWQPGEGIGPDRPAPGTDDGGGGTPPTGVGPAASRGLDADGYEVTALAGTVVRSPIPGINEVVHGGVAPRRVERLGGGTLDPSLWTLHEDSTVTFDATTLPPGTWTGWFDVTDAEGNSTGRRDIIFHVTRPESVLVEAQLARPDRVVVAPGVRQSFSRSDALVHNDEVLGGRVEIVGPRPTWLGPVNATTGVFTVDARQLAEGRYTFTYRLSAGPTAAPSAPTTVNVDVDNDNTCATARPDHYEAPAGGILRIPAERGALANDSDPDADPLKARLVGGAFANPGLSFAPDGSIVYDARQAQPGFRRAFQYHAVDPDGELCAAAWVELDVVAIPGPSTNENRYEIRTGATMTVPARGVLANDLDGDLDGPETLRATIERSIPGLTLRSDGGFTYRAPLAAGEYTATYRARDEYGGVSAPEDIVFVVSEDGPLYTNRPPRAVDDKIYRVHADEILVVGEDDGVLANDSDPDGDDLFAEPVGPSTERFPLTREGTFTFRPTLQEVGRTFSFRYVAVEKGYVGAQSNQATVRIQVVAPRERCRASTVELVTERLDDGLADDDMFTTTQQIGVCWDKTKVTRVGLLDDGAFVTSDTASSSRRSLIEDASTSTSTSVNVLLAGVPFIGLHVKGIGDDNVAVSWTPDEATLTLRSEYRICANPLAIVDAFLPLLRSAKAFLALIRLEKVFDRILDAVRSSKFAAALDHVAGIIGLYKKGLTWLGFASIPTELLSAADTSDELASNGDLRKLVTTLIQRFLKQQVKVEKTPKPDGEKAGTKPLKSSMTILSFILDQLDDTDYDWEILDNLTCVGIPFVTLASNYEAEATWRIRPNGAVFDASGSPELVTPGFADEFVRIAQALDLLANGDVSLGLRADVVDIGTPVVVGCDLTRTRLGQANSPPTAFPGLTPARC